MRLAQVLAAYSPLPVETIEYALRRMPVEKWKNPEGKQGCPECNGFGYHEDGSDEGRECATCEGNGVADVNAAQEFIAARQRGDE